MNGGKKVWPTNETLEQEMQLRESPTEETPLEGSLEGSAPEVPLEG